jgi:Ca-activated chloride channel homolog
MTMTTTATIQSSDIGTRATTRTLGELLGLDSKTTKKSRYELEAIPFPLVKVVVRTHIIADCAVTELEEHYANPHARAMDVVHTIPLPADGAVTAFEMIAGARRIAGVCKKTEDAKADFESAKKRGKTAAIVESVRDDVHVIRLANVPAKTSIIVKLRIVERLRVDDGRFEFRFPTTISEKFVPGDAIDHAGYGIKPDTESAPDASRLTPPIRLEGGTALDCEITLAAGATDISSNLSLSRHDNADGTICLRPVRGASCDRDIVVRSWARGSDAITRAYTDGERTIVVVDPPARRTPQLETAREAVFVIDRSGSMDGHRLSAAKRALARALQSLSARDTFEIIAFENKLDRFQKEPVTATNDHLTRALKWLEKIVANGGTQAMPALEAACVGRVAPGRVRTVLFLTDGDVGNDGEIIDLTRRFDPATRLFVVGIGVSPSNAFISRLARLGGGTHLIVEDGDEIEAEITRFEAAFAGPMACGLGEDGARQHSTCDLFAGRASVFFLEGAREQVKVTSTDGRFNAECVVQRTVMPLGALWARDRVMHLEDRIIARPHERELIEGEIVNIGVAHQIQTRLTSFVAVDELSQVHGEPIEIVQPMDRVRDRSVLQCIAMPSFAMRSNAQSDSDEEPNGQRMACFAPMPAPQSPAESFLSRRGRNATSLIGVTTLAELLCIILATFKTGRPISDAMIQQLIAALDACAIDPRNAQFVAALQSKDFGEMCRLALEMTGEDALDQLYHSA